MADVWYIFDDRGQLGPLKLQELTITLATYENAREILVWRDGFQEWIRAGDVPELAGTVIIPPAPRPLRAARAEPLDPAAKIKSDGASKSAKARWTVYGVLVGLTICLADLIFGWRGPRFYAWSGSGLADNLGYIFGTIIGAMFIGLIAGAIRDGFSAHRIVSPHSKSEDQDSVKAPEAINPGRRENFIARNWRGDFPLWIAYWVFGFLGNIVIGIILLLAVSAMSANAGYEPRNIFATLVSIWLCVVAFAIWQFVGVWKSADRYLQARSRLNKRAPWAVLARLAVILGALQFVITFGKTGLPQITEASRMAFMDDPSIPAYSIRIMRNGSEVEITGGFKYGLTDDFIIVLRASSQIRVVHLNSLGGRIGEAEKLNKVIRDRGLITYVAFRCMSACTVGFAAGRERWLRNGAVLGFHAPSFPGMSVADMAEATKAQKDIFEAAGIEHQFIVRALSTPNKEMWTPSSDELLRARVITALSDGSNFAVSGFASDVTRESMAVSLMKALPALRTMKTRFVKDYNSVIDAYYESYVSGQTEAETFAAARSKYLPVIIAFRPLADDAVLVDLGRLYAEQYATLGAKNPTLCYLYASGLGGTRNLSSEISADLIQRELSLGERIIATAKERPAVTDAMTAPLWEKVFGQIAKRGFGVEKVKLLQESAVDPSKHAEYCATSVAVFQEVSNLKQSDAALIMRQVFSDK